MSILQRFSNGTMFVHICTHNELVSKQIIRSKVTTNLTETTDFIRSTLPEGFHPRVGIILGSGLSGICEGTEVLSALNYHDIPHFPVSTVDSHKAVLSLGFLGGASVAAFQGRFHYYEGYSAESVVYPIRVLRELGAEIVILTNACGGLNPQFRAGEIMLMEDHINLQWANPLSGKSTDQNCFVDMSCPYSKRLATIAENAALAQKITLRKGTYLAVSGPNYETRAELRFMRKIGADVVGMSSVPETLIARQLRMEVLGLSLITNECRPDAPHSVSHDEVIETAAKAEQNLRVLLRDILRLC